MIICNTKCFIFAKNKKVGSSSVEIYLSNHLNRMVDTWYGERGFRGEPDYAAFNVFTTNKDPHIKISDILDNRNRDYYKTIIERNPWDQYVSMYEYQQAQGHEPFSPKKFFDFNYEIYNASSDVLVDDFILYEDLTSGMQRFCNRVGIPFDENLWNKHRFKSSSRKSTTERFYDNNPELADQVEESAWFHIQNLGYVKP